ncbi:5-formyltetrahydrofolate cyclo-ligase [Asticcacaulis excentricus]|uniref:5-formyltetrahydrofolate cyclo-ligase n=1 Tax=Asticcacaulis excentricus (strain ATCC 15261 / DSM 4724 / KCTC 12464 / NCIMB 9791 / VKM B-1370 / CB 48) TaxID=573065 RepID=E8RQS6_ASTEC|nr:5-formyltetrahydrofolate cyclo-ligase [Asticcacaulis excentricus]ADU13304.1 5-formyltetrahydrofolate cyclo-ligase [Asticcacaulis excentricus CB 48]
MSDAKAAMRKEMKVRRAALAAACPDAGERLARAFLAQGGWPKASVVAGFHPIRDEIDPRPLMRHFQARGYTLALPSVEAEGRMIFRAYTLDARLVAGPLGTHQPGPDAPEVFPDLILAPLLAFDREGGRLGYGGGFYDRALDYLRCVNQSNANPLQVWGVAFSAQAVARVPTEPHDQRLDTVLTEEGLIEIRKNT